ncbi:MULTISPECIES: UvrD-helicase domain-containing protein [Caballeronia]|uniref:UvrD-helicase domain-containing protein n=1 Tax=Caballeronia TaxID=1827195 RepID=UPI001EF65E03|nr:MULTISPECIES: UvrD-helicase domain-containing protein [Caballeronia]MCG7400489.1 UvrD-helicase domain-containing protein [Caballeronia zhejiangensis]
MTHGKTQSLRDDHARRIAMCVHDLSLLVEAGAGSGKTAVMAGRIALMLANGAAPGTIAAVTFTELAASELLSRVREFVTELSAGRIRPELRIALPDGLSSVQLAHLAASSASIDEITCSTIHGFCQRLIKPYPVEADLDPGASVMVRNQGDLVFGEIVDGWLRERLAGGQTSVLAEMVMEKPAETVTLLTKIAENLRRRRTLRASAAPALQALLQVFVREATDFADFARRAPASEPDSARIAGALEKLAASVAANVNPMAPAALVRILVSRPDESVCTKQGTFRNYSKKGKWNEAAKAQGLSRAEGDRLNEEATDRYNACRDAWTALVEAAATHALAALIDDAKQILARYRDYKRTAALLDFDDLIFAARDLLRDHDAVRRALGERYRHVLVDEFQDTDPLQTEIFWRLCGDPAVGTDSKDWTQFRIRPGALFLVGDPKQAIYRFRGADVGAYVQARDAFRAQNPQSVLSISTNFRSCTPILDYVNARFEAVLSGTGQPGFIALDPFHGDRGEQPCVAALDIAVPDEDGESDTSRQRDAEAEAVGDLCARLVSGGTVLDRRTGEARACRPGDIALLAPTGSDLWRYEEALERRGIPVATQAGKGFFRRQEIQDLIAITRVLAERKDALALGALLRGPLVGLTDEELLDIVWALPRTGDGERVARLDLTVDREAIAHPLARDVIGKLQALTRHSHATTPYHLLSQAIDVMRVRHILRERHGREAERALANVDLYLGLSAAYAVRGLSAFSEAMTVAWSDEEKAVEGQADAQEEAVALLTMHASKGLEWPVVIPVNTMTGVKAADGAVGQRATDTFLCPVLGINPSGYAEAREDEKAELARERIRLWYVAATRARELLVLPRLNVEAPENAWIGLLDLAIDALPALDVGGLASAVGTAATVPENAQTRTTFAAEAQAIAERERRLLWLAPSRDESASGPVLQRTEPDASQSIVTMLDAGPGAPIQGGRERGLILHKLFEEVLTGETADDSTALAVRATELIAMFPRLATADASRPISAQELADCVTRTLKLPEIAPLRATLIPEYPVYRAIEEGSCETATSGVADALTLGADGRPVVVIDWKGDVRPDARTVEHYCSQVRAYLDITGAQRGLIVFATTGAIVAVEPTMAAAIT